MKQSQKKKLAVLLITAMLFTLLPAGAFAADTTGNEVLEPGESCTITFTVKWKKDSTAKSASAEFDIELDYEQSTEEFKGSASHNSVHTK